MIPDVLTVALGERTYDIFFGEGIHVLLQEWICRFFGGRTVFVVTDRNVEKIYGEDIRRWLAGIPHAVHAISPGEEQKTAETLRGIYAFLARGNADRESLVVAFGGGIVGDLAGFAAATFLRGIPCIQVPTTLLAQVDSSVGGKTGYNLPEGKNLVGAFHQPRAVFIDPGFLRTLDARNLRAGLAEAVKCGLAGDETLWNFLAERADRWKGLRSDEWQTLIRRAVAFKAAIVEADERESSTRRLLNLGHTIGHAMERAAGYGTMLHGEAVAIGLAWEAVLGSRLGVTPPALAERVRDLLRAMGFPLDDDAVPLSAVASALSADKKRVVSDITLPLVSAPGRCVLTPVPIGVIRDALPSLREEIRRGDAGAAAPGEPAAPEKAPAPESDDAEALEALERRVAADPRNIDALLRLSRAYFAAGRRRPALETVKAVLHQSPGEQRALRLAREIAGKEGGSASPEPADAGVPLEDVLILGEETFELRPVEGEGARAEEARPSAAIPVPEEAAPPPSAVPVRTVTMASLYWKQGDRETARRIVAEILASDPVDPRALAWEAEHAETARTTGGDPLGELATLMRCIAKEYAYELSGHH